MTYENFHDFFMRLVFPTLGIVYLICGSDIFEYPRKLLSKIPIIQNLILCEICTATWVGLFLVLEDAFPFLPHWFKIIKAVMALLGTLLILDELILRFGEKNGTDENDSPRKKN